MFVIIHFDLFLHIDQTENKIPQLAGLNNSNSIVEESKPQCIITEIRVRPYFTAHVIELELLIKVNVLHFNFKPVILDTIYIYFVDYIQYLEIFNKTDNIAAQCRAATYCHNRTLQCSCYCLLVIFLRTISVHLRLQFEQFRNPVCLIKTTRLFFAVLTCLLPQCYRIFHATLLATTVATVTTVGSTVTSDSHLRQQPL